MSAPKDGTPEYVWFNAIQCLQSLVDPSDPRYLQYEAILLGEVNMALYVMADFCATAPPDAVQPTVSNFEDGSWVTVMTNYAMNAFWNNYCE